MNHAPVCAMNRAMRRVNFTFNRVRRGGASSLSAQGASLPLRAGGGLALDKAMKSSIMRALYHTRV